MEGMKTLIPSVLLFLAIQPAYSVDSCQTFFEKSTSRPVRVGTRHARAETDLYFNQAAGKVEEHSIREGSVAAHLYLDSGTVGNPYFFVAFPSGNSGVALWFKSAGHSLIEATSRPKALRTDGGLNGIGVELKTAAKELEIEDSLLGSMRFIRDRELGRGILERGLGPYLDRVTRNRVSFENGALILTRTGLNGLSEYLLRIEPMGDTRIIKDGDSYRLVSSSEVRFKMVAATNEKPLTPIALKDFFKEDALKEMDPKRLMALSFLAYKEKLMAGSPRYLSKFGRDSIYTLNVFMDFMKPEAIESLLTATISSLNPRTGLVSHEQHEGDFVSFVRLKNHRKYKGVTDPIEDHKMIDDDLAFTHVVADYLEKHPERAQEFLNRKDARGIVQRELLTKLFAYVEKQAIPFVNAVRNGKSTREELHPYLMRLKGHESTGQWRDSDWGLGGGKYPFDVNAALMPAALKSLAKLAARSDVSNPFHDPRRAAELENAFEIWNTKVVSLFEVRVPKEQLEAHAIAFFRNTGRDPSLLPPAPKEDLVFPAISLDAQGRPVRVMHSDDSLMMTFGYPSAEYLASVSRRIQLPFPYGLRTEIGIVVANPIFALAEIQRRFGDQHYHGTVIWTMQEDLLVYGMVRQIQQRLESEVSAQLKQELRESIRLIERLVAERGDLGGIEVFSIRRENGRVFPESFAGDAKGNSNQLWGHLRLILTKTLKDLDLSQPH